jgi:hypothetical protein
MMIKIQTVDMPFQEAIEEVMARFKGWHEYDVAKHEKNQGVDFYDVNLINDSGDYQVVKSIRIIVEPNGEVTIHGLE